MRAPELRLRAPTAGLLALPWELPLSEWMVPDVALRDIAVGPSRHLVKFVECDGALWAVKELPPRLAVREYDVLRRLEELELNAVRPAGLVVQRDFDSAILVTRYLEGPGSTAGCSCGCPRISPDTARGCTTRWRHCSWSCTATASSG